MGGCRGAQGCSSHGANTNTSEARAYPQQHRGVRRAYFEGLGRPVSPTSLTLTNGVPAKTVRPATAVGRRTGAGLALINDTCTRVQGAARHTASAATTRCRPHAAAAAAAAVLTHHPLPPVLLQGEQCCGQAAEQALRCALPLSVCHLQA